MTRKTRETYKTVKLTEASYGSACELRRVMVKLGYDKANAAMGVDWFDDKDELSFSNVLNAACFHLAQDIIEETGEKYLGSIRWDKDD